MHNGMSLLYCHQYLENANVSTKFLTFFLTTYYSNRNTERESTQSEGKGMTRETDVKEKPDYDLCVQKGLT